MTSAVFLPGRGSMNIEFISQDNDGKDFFATLISGLSFGVKRVDYTELGVENFYLSAEKTINI